MPPTLVAFDWAIKHILRDKANFDILSGLLTELLGKNVVVQELLESETNKNLQDDKTNRLDLKAKIDDGEIAIFEVQVNRVGGFFQRILFGTSKAVTEQLSEGDNYENIKKVYSIDIIYFELGEGDDYIYHGTTNFVGLHNNKTLLLSESEKKYLPRPIEGDQNAGELFPEYYLIYPRRFNEEIKNKFDEWVYLFKKSTVKSEFSAAGIKKAGKALDVMRMTKADYNDYQNYLKWARVKNSEWKAAIEDSRTEGLAEGRAEGEAKGRAEGKAEKAIEVAKNLKNLKIPPAQISQATGLTTEEIENL